MGTKHITSISNPKTTFPKIAPILPEEAVSAKAIALKKKHKCRFVYFDIHKISYLRFVGNKSTMTQKITASRILVSASKIHDSTNV
jgi:hypothetical protein